MQQRDAARKGLMMNDFTKEDLNQLMDACMYWFECPYDGILKEAHHLVAKIQTMIDNYKEDCEKSWPSNMIEPCPSCKEFHGA